MKITVCSWFDKKRLEEASRVVSISRSEPSGVSFDEKIWEFVPSSGLLSSYKAGAIDEAEYKEAYLEEVLPAVVKGIQQLQDGDVLCCWEKDGNFCHRRILAETLAERGVEVEIR